MNALGKHFFTVAIDQLSNIDLPSNGVWVLFLLYPFFLCHSSPFGYYVLNFSYSLLFWLMLVKLPFFLQIDTGYISAPSGQIS